MTTLRAGNVVGNVITTWQEPPTGILDSLEAARRLVREAGQRYGLRHARYGKFFPAARLVVFREHHPEDIVQIADNLISLSVNSDEHRCCQCAQAIQRTACSSGGFRPAISIPLC